MKIIFRTLVILLAAALVGGIIFALVGNTSQTSSGFDRHGGAEFRPGDNGEDFAPRPERDREEFGGGFFFPEGVIKGLLVVSMAMVIWLNVGRLFSRRKAIQVK
jgi:hypothetical protein